MNKTAFLMAIALTALVVSGCGNGMVPVSGTLTMDGEPIEGAVVAFIAEGHTPAKGTTDVDGQFSLTSVEKNDGAMPGMYTVTVSKITTTPLGNTGDAPDEDLDGALGPEKIDYNGIPQHYSVPRASGLQEEVKRGMDSVVIDLDSKSKPAM